MRLHSALTPLPRLGHGLVRDCLFHHPFDQVNRLSLFGAHPPDWSIAHPMNKILLINNYNYRRGGADVVYLEQARLLKSRGWRVSQLSMRHPQNDACEQEEYFSEEIEFGSQDGFLSKVRHAGKIIYSSEAYQKTRKLIHREKPDIVHAHNVYHHLSPSVLKAAHDCGVPVVLTVHDLKLLCPAYSMISNGEVCEECKVRGRSSVVRKRCMKGSLALSTLVYVETLIHSAIGIYKKNIDLIFAPSKFFIEKFREWQWDGPPLIHIPNFVDISSVSPVFAPGDYFVYFGRMSLEKGLITLVDAASIAGATVYLVGSGPMEAALRARVSETGADVRFCGFQSGKALWALVSGSRATVLASQWYENAPLTIIEGYACGKPAIGARIGGIPELIEPGGTGELFTSGDVDDLAAVLRRYIEMSNDAIEGQGRVAYEWANREFAPDCYIDRITNAYQRIL
ncbi:glycosyltransferase [Thiocapsa roseopersicina]|uniref:Glycosyltransferase involved in cell wall bisynthesis n=1 Tax=Thiocapsa roseopersicina TaxID=1058 RepID=A0A1H2Y435_THIRO|nr:glycosyltransferase [Thiocapsa roseopersicina]SDW99942.1 Glycosyltransferase involved in cell wall bisynthesis [Thiocapsa roseopersicina]